MRGSYSGNTLAFQAKAESSILLPRSTGLEMFVEKRNFLSPIEFNSSFKQILANDTVPWFYSKNTAYDTTDDQSKWDFSFSNVVYDQGQPTSRLGEHCETLLRKICLDNKLTLKKILRIRLGLITKTPSPVIHNAHVDFEVPHLTALYYLSTTNGPTIFYNQTFPNNFLLTEQVRVNCEENKVVIFNGMQYHSSCSQTDVKQRVVINFNFIAE